MHCTEIPNALIQKGLRPLMWWTTPGLRNTECPDSKGIKTQRAKRDHHTAAEIPNALIQKGLRRGLDCSYSFGGGNTECPDSKGIKTQLLCSAQRGWGNTECPDSKGIKTALCNKALTAT